MGWLQRFTNLFRSSQMRDDAVDEISFHLEQRIADHMARGMTKQEAERLARIQLGNQRVLEEDTVQADTLAWLENGWRDLRVAWRMHKRAPALSVVALASLALGIGVNTMVFTVTKRVVLDAMPVPHPERIYLLHNRGEEEGHVHSDGSESSFSYPLFQDLARATKSVFTGVTAQAMTQVALTHGSVTQRIPCAMVAGNFFQVFEVHPWRGSFFTPQDDRKPDASPKVVLAYSLWRTEFGSDESIVGRTIHINTKPFVVAGIAPPDFYGIQVDEAPRLFVPIMMKDEVAFDDFTLFDRLNHWLVLAGRLQPDVSAKKAQAALNVVYPRLHDQDVAFMHAPSADFLARFRHGYVEMTPGGKGYSDLRANLQKPLLYVSVMSLVVLLITAVNIANLLVARAAAREREIAIRLSVGASQATLLRQALLESIALALVGGALGALLAFAGTPLLLHRFASNVSQAADIRPDGYTLVLTAVCSIVTGIAFGLLPAVTGLRTKVTAALTAEGGTGHSSGRLWLRRSLVGSQIALSFILVSVCILFAGSVRNLHHIQLGFDTANVTTFKLNALDAGYSPERISGFASQVLDTLKAAPGVQDAGLAVIPVLEGDDWGQNVTVEGWPKQANPSLNAVSAGFFDTIRMHMVAGRAFTEREVDGQSTLAVVNQEFVKEFIPSGVAIGKHFHLGSPRSKGAQWTIIGVVANHHHEDARDKLKPFLFLPYSSQHLDTLAFYVRSSAPKEQVATIIRSSVARVDPAVPAFDIRSLDDVLAGNFLSERGLAVLSGLFACIALALAVVGLYGVVSYSVTKRRKEFGIRMAIGANGGRVVGMVLRETILLCGSALLIAAPLALGACSLMRSSMYGVSDHDPLVFLAAAALLFAIALLSAAIPAWNAGRINPQNALRTA